MAVQTEHLGHFQSLDEAKKKLEKVHPSFTIGNKHSWFVKKEYSFNGEPIELEWDSKFIDTNKFPTIVKRQRRGWYLHPHPIHSLVRRLIKFSVIVLLICLMYLFIEPVLAGFGLPGFGTQTIRFGLLDYPLLAILVVPLLFAPILMRVYGNFSDLRSQQGFLKAEIENPHIVFHSETSSDSNLEISIEFPYWSDQWREVEVSWQVGILPPSRNALLTAHQRTEKMQPPPGLSTELPHHWEASLDDGTAGGEDAPMDSRLVSGGLFLRPMRICEKGQSSVWKEGQILKLAPPSTIWPGTTCTELIRIHWECIITIHRNELAPLYYVQPLKVHYPLEKIKIDQISIHDGRIELNDEHHTTS